MRAQGSLSAVSQRGNRPQADLLQGVGLLAKGQRVSVAQSSACLAPLAG
jgi:hypothetical protein